ncbi:molybdopterin oxidoreductase family protein [Pseudonocardiaceae bacterium YIM PH 21723]|nr:molybdopterin oxidoreductase family protein [Pseudonocardiaceae bacterium YIM PH 21723]
MAEWQKSACILCECNCGLEVQVADRRMLKIRGDKDHPSSAGYTCEKPLRLDKYNSNANRLTSPLRRTPDGEYEEISWETAFAEIAAKLKHVRETYGGDKIFHYGGSGQGGHTNAGYGYALMNLLGGRYKSNALAQEKTGEAFVDAVLFGSHSKGDFENAQVTLFIGKNPWQSHSFPRSRPTLKQMAADPDRTMIVMDPRKTETAAMADIHLQVKPGTDAWCLAAMIAVLFQEDLINHAWLAKHAVGLDEVRATFADLDVATYAARCGVDEELLRQASRAIAGTTAATTYEDLGTQMGPNSTLVSYLQKQLWLLTGNFGNKGSMFIHSWLAPLNSSTDVIRDEPYRPSRLERPLVAALDKLGLVARLLPWLGGTRLGGRIAAWFSRTALEIALPLVGPAVARDLLQRTFNDHRPLGDLTGVRTDREWFEKSFDRTPVSGATIVAGLIPGSAIVDEVNTDHPDRLRVLWIDATNPLHSLPGSQEFTKAMRSVELSVVVDIAMTETARQADYVLPSANQFERWENTFFNVEFPHNCFQLRKPLMEPLAGTKAEPEIYAELIRATGLVDQRVLDRLHRAAGISRETWLLTLFISMRTKPELMGMASYLAYETLGPVLPAGRQQTAPVYLFALSCAIFNRDSVTRAGFIGKGAAQGNALYEAIVDSPSGVVFTLDEWKHAFNYLRYPDRRFRLAFPLMLEEFGRLAEQPANDPRFPLVLSAGERRAFTANTIYRDPTWRRRDAEGALRISPQDAEELGVTADSRVRVVTANGAAESTVEITDTMLPGHISLPNGMGLDEADEHGVVRRVGVALNQLTDHRRRDPFLGTPWHKNVPARVEVLVEAPAARIAETTSART